MTDTRALSEVLSDFRFALLTTSDLTARPLTVQEVDGETVRFLIDVEAEWTARAQGSVLLGLADPQGKYFASVTGDGTVSDDREVIARLYSPVADRFFDGADDPRIRVLEVAARTGEWWDGPSDSGPVDLG